MPKRDYLKLWTLLILLVFLCAACAPTPAPVTITPASTGALSPLPATKTSTPISKNTVEFQCIASYDSYAFSAIYWEDHIDMGIILPLPPWQFETSFPETTTKSAVRYVLPFVEGTRVIQGREELWVSRKIVEISSRITQEYLIYQPETQKWEIIPAEVEEIGETVEAIWIADDNTVWGLTLANHSVFQNSSRFISKFNEASRRFEYVADIRGIFLSNQRVVFDGKESIFWFFTPNDAIYRYDPHKQEVTEIADLGDINVISAVMSPNGTFYFRQPFYDPALRTDELYQFNSETGEIIPIAIPDEPFPSAPLFVDKNENLWMVPFGSLQPNGTWRILHPNPQDYFDNAKSRPAWDTVQALLESSNGYIWFRRNLGKESDGMAWLDPSTGEGCWFTTEAASIIEDNNQTLWLVVNQSLYSLDLSNIPIHVGQ